MKRVYLLIVVILTTIGLAQPTIEWARCYGGSDWEIAGAIQQTGDGGYIVAGGSCSNDGDVSGLHGIHDFFDYWVIKLDSEGDLVWQKCLGGSYDDWAWSIQQGPDGGYIVAGLTKSYDGDVSGFHDYHDYWVVKLDSLGNILWQKCLGGYWAEEAYSIQQTRNGEYIVTGFAQSYDGDVSGNHGIDDYWVVKLDSLGCIMWQKCLGGSSSERANSIQQTYDGGYIVAGGSGSNDGDVSGNNGGGDCWVVKLNSLGDIVWQKCLGGSSSDLAYSIQQTYDSGYIVAGISKSTDGDVSGYHWTVGGDDPDYWVVKLDSFGNILWQKCLGGYGADEAHSIQQISDGGYIVTGSSSSNNGDVSGNNGSSDYWVVKLNSVGNIVWQKCLGGSFDDHAFSAQQTVDGGYIVAGYSGSNDCDVSGNHGGNDFWVVKLSRYDGISENFVPEQFTISAYPNPFNSSVAITVGEGFTPSRIEIYDINGRMVEIIPPGPPLTRGEEESKSPLSKGDLGGFVWQPDAALGSGVYLVRAVIPGNKGFQPLVQTKRVVYLK